jgi:hypothetical protein
MESEVTLPRSQEPTTGLYAEADESSPHFPLCFFKIHFHIIFPSTSSLF